LSGTTGATGCLTVGFVVGVDGVNDGVGVVCIGIGFGLTVGIEVVVFADVCVGAGFGSMV
jgi:hypothetical protein